jgi:hypothetical protein
VANQVTLKETVDSLETEPVLSTKSRTSASTTGRSGRRRLYAARSIVDDRSVIEGRTPQQKAQAWLEGVAEEPDEVKDLVMQQLWRREDFQNA